MVKKKEVSLTDWLQAGLIRICTIHFGFVAVYALYIIASDATRLITPELVYSRWRALGLLLSITVVLWYASRNHNKQASYYRYLIYALILADIAFATFNVYTQRGMASRAVMFYALPIVVSAVLLSRVATLTTATIAAVAYTLAAVKYFVDFFNEGYKAELYLEVGIYVASFYILAGLLNVIIRFKYAEKDFGL